MRADLAVSKAIFMKGSAAQTVNTIAVYTIALQSKATPITLRDGALGLTDSEVHRNPMNRP